MTASIPEPSGPPPAETLGADTRIFAVGALKGGTGKTRIAMLIALVLAVVFKRRVLVFDADSGSQTSSNWPVKARLRGYDWPIEVIRHPFETLDEEIDRALARGDVDDIVVDVGGGNYPAFLAAVRRAHKLLVPLCPDEGDLEQAPKTREAAYMAAARNSVGGCLMYYVLSRCENSNDKIDARNQLLDEEHNGEDGAYPLLDTDIPMLVSWKRAFGRVPQFRRSASDPDCPRWKDLTGLIPLMLETEILGKQEVLDAGLMTLREVEDLEKRAVI